MSSRARVSARGPQIWDSCPEIAMGARSRGPAVLSPGVIWLVASQLPLQPAKSPLLQAAWARLRRLECGEGGHPHPPYCNRRVQPRYYCCVSVAAVKKPHSNLAQNSVLVLLRLKTACPVCSPVPWELSAPMARQTAERYDVRKTVFRLFVLSAVESGNFGP